MTVIFYFFVSSCLCADFLPFTFGLVLPRLVCLFLSCASFHSIDPLTNLLYTLENRRVYQAYKIRNNPSFIAAVFRDLFPKGLPFATVDAFFAQLADSEELQLVLAQARDVYMNQNVQHNAFVKRLMEMAGLEPDVLRAMYASKKEEAEKGGK